MSIYFINSALTLAYVATIIDILLQIRQVWRRKSSADVSILGVTIRTVASGIFLTKFFILSDYTLIVGQTCSIILMLLYITLLIMYRKKV